MLIDNQKKKKKPLTVRANLIFIFRSILVSPVAVLTPTYLLVIVMKLEHSVTPEVNIYSHWTSTEPSKSSLRCHLFRKVKRNSQTSMDRAINHQLLNSVPLL